MRSTKAGMIEYELEARFQYEIYKNGGCRRCAYTSICACGPNGAGKKLYIYIFSRTSILFHVYIYIYNSLFNYFFNIFVVHVSLFFVNFILPIILNIIYVSVILYIYNQKFCITDMPARQTTVRYSKPIWHF